MITALRKTVARSITIATESTRPLRLVVYLQPNGKIVFRRHRGRKRYMLDLVSAMDRAMSAGPICGLFELLLDQRTEEKSAKEVKTVATKKKPASKKKSAKAVKQAQQTAEGDQCQS